MRMLLVIAGLTLVWLNCGSGNAEPKDVLLPRNELPQHVVGHGAKVETAKRTAIAKAIDEISGVMAKHNLTSFKLTEEYLDKHVLIDEGKQGKDFDALPNAEPFKSWIVTFRSESDWCDDIVRRDHEARRQQIAESRQTVGSQVIIALGLLLFVGVGYVRLDEYTKRRYTTLLRLG